MNSTRFGIGYTISKSGKGLVSHRSRKLRRACWKGTSGCTPRPHQIGTISRDSNDHHDRAVALLPTPLLCTAAGHLCFVVLSAFFDLWTDTACFSRDRDHESIATTLKKVQDVMDKQVRRQELVLMPDGASVIVLDLCSDVTSRRGTSVLTSPGCQVQFEEVGAELKKVPSLVQSCLDEQIANVGDQGLSIREWEWQADDEDDDEA